MIIDLWVIEIYCYNTFMDFPNVISCSYNQ